MKKISIIIIVTLFSAVMTSCGAGYKKRDGKMFFTDYEGGDIYRTFFELEGADPRSFRSLKTELDSEWEYISGDFYAVDKYRAYWKQHPIEGADPETFRPIDEDYSVDGKQIYYQEKLLSTADPRTFRVEDGYAADCDNVYWDGEILEEMDGKTFTSLGYGYARDKNGIYTPWGHRHTVSDPATFHHFGKPYEKARNKSEYILRLMKDRFYRMEDWACDKDYYYYKGHRIEGADYATINFLDENGRTSYIKDKYRVFYCGDYRDSIFIVKGADADTFEAIDLWDYARDKNNFYNEGVAMTDDEAAMFREKILQSKYFDAKLKRQVR